MIDKMNPSFEEIAARLAGYDPDTKQIAELLGPTAVTAR